MNYLTYKIVFGDDKGATVFKKIANWWDSAKKIDDTYMGAEFYWAFFQLGDFDMIDMTIVKWEVWSTWRLKNPSEYDKGPFVGVSCGLFFYSPEKEESYTQMKQSVDLFLTKRKSESNPLIIVALYDHKRFNAQTIEQQPFMQDQKDFCEVNGAQLLILEDTIIDSDLRPNLQDIYSRFLKILQPGLTTSLKIDNNFWYLPLPELRAILMADRKGIKIRARHLPPLPKVVEPAPVSAPAIPTASITTTAPTEQMENVAIAPTGEIVPLKKDITKEEIVELIRKGYKLPAWFVIPRHCPKCFNQNQRTILEIVDKSIVLMQNPMIYGTKYQCRNCSHTWH